MVGKAQGRHHAAGFDAAQDAAFFAAVDPSSTPAVAVDHTTARVGGVRGAY